MDHSFYNGLTVLERHSAPFATLVQLILEGAPREEFYEVQNFCKEVGLSVTLEEIRITKEDELRVIAEKFCVEGEAIHNMTGDVTPNQLYDAMGKADVLEQLAGK